MNISDFSNIMKLTSLLRALEGFKGLGEKEAHDLRQVRKALEDYASLIMVHKQAPTPQFVQREGACPICGGSRVAAVKNDSLGITERVVCWGCAGRGIVEVGGK